MQPQQDGFRPVRIQSNAYPRPVAQRVSTIPVQASAAGRAPRDFSLRPISTHPATRQPQPTSVSPEIPGFSPVDQSQSAGRSDLSDEPGGTLESEPVVERFESSALEAAPQPDQAQASELLASRKNDRFSLFRLNRLALGVTASVVALILLVGGGALFLTSHQANGGATDDQLANNYTAGTSIKLAGAGVGSPLGLNEINQLTVNGQLQLSDTVVVKPTARPSSPQAGQIYYDQTTNQPYYYNGQQFVSLAPQGGVTSLGGSTGTIGLGSGLVVTGGQLSLSSDVLQRLAASGSSTAISSYVASLQGQSGDVTLGAGPGISINGTAISNSGVISLASGSPNLVIGSDGAGHYTVTDTGGGSGVTSITGTANQVNVSSSTGNVTLSLPQDIATTSSPTFNNLTAHGTLGVTGNVTGGTYNTAAISGGSLSTGGVNGLGVTSSAITASGALSVSAGGTNQNLTLQASGSGSVIIQTPILHNANGATYSFDGSDGSGVNATICTTVGNCAGAGGSVITPGGTNGTIAMFSGPNTIANSILTQSGTTVSVGGALAAAGALQGGTLSISAGAFQVNGSGNVTGGTYNTAAISGGTLSGGSFTGGSVSAGTITGGSLSVSAVNGLGVTSSAITGPGALSISAGGTNQNLALQGSGTGAVIVQTPTFHNANGATYSFDAANGSGVNATVCTTLGNCAGAGGGITGSGTTGTIAVFTDTGAIGNSTLTQSGSTVTASGNLVIQGTNSLSLGTAGPSGNTGSIIFNNSTNSNALTLQAGATASNLTLTLPTADGAPGDCLQTDSHGNLSFQACTGGAGGGVTSVNGEIGTLVVDNATGTPGHVTINDASTSQKGIAQFNSTNFSASGGTINTIQGIATTSSPTFAGLTATGTIQGSIVNATSTLELNGADINTVGTLTHVAYLNAASNNFTGTTLQHNGNNVCDASNNCSYAPASGSANYIQNGTSPQTANFNITGSGTVGGFTSTMPALFQDSTQSSTAFQILDGATPLFVADDSYDAIGISMQPVAGLGVLQVNGDAYFSDYLVANGNHSGAITLGSNCTNHIAGLCFGNGMNLYNYNTGASLRTSSDFTTDGVLTVNGTGTSSIGGELTVGTDLGVGGNIYMGNNAGLYMQDNGANYRQVLTYSTANNVVLANRASTGSVQIENLNAGGSIQLRVGTGSNLAESISGTGAALFQNTTDSTGAFQVQNHAGTSLLNVDTTDSVVKIDASTALSIGNGYMYDNGGGTFRIGATNTVFIQEDNNSNTAFQVSNTSGTSILNVNSNNSRVCIDNTTCTHTLGVTGTIAASGAITASTTPDISETIPSAADVTPGDVVSAGPDGNVDAVRSSVPYDPTAIGVISDGTSSFRINSNGGSEDAADTGKYLVLAGRVPVHVTDENGPIEPGDYLTTSSTPGYAMKATRPGPTIGKALAAFNGTSGSVMTQTNLGYYSGPSNADYLQNGGNAALANLEVSGTATIDNLTVTTLNADSATLGTLTVTGSAQFTGNITVGGHVITSGTAPTAQAQTAAGPGAACTVTGNDTGGSITIVTGATGLADGKQCVLTFHSAFSAAPDPVIAARNKTSAQAQAFVDSDSHTMTVEFSNPPAPNTTYSFNYFNTQ
jgi:hypothetical protein